MQANYAAIRVTAACDAGMPRRKPRRNQRTAEEVPQSKKEDCNWCNRWNLCNFSINHRELCAPLNPKNQPNHDLLIDWIKSISVERTDSLHKFDNPRELNETWWFEFWVEPTEIKNLRVKLNGNDWVNCCVHWTPTRSNRRTNKFIHFVLVPVSDSVQRIRLNM